MGSSETVLSGPSSYIFSSFYNHLCVQARRGLSAQEGLSTETEQSGYLAVCAIVKDQQEVNPQHLLLKCHSLYSSTAVHSPKCAFQSSPAFSVVQPCACHACKCKLLCTRRSLKCHSAVSTPLDEAKGMHRNHPKRVVACRA